MTFLLFALAVVLIGVTVRLLIHAAVLPRIQIHLHLRQIEGYGFDVGKPGSGDTARERLNASMSEAVERLGRFTMTRVPSLPALKRSDLTAAGHYKLTPESVHGYRVIAAVGVPALLLFFFVATGSLSLITLFLVACAAVGGWEIPALVIRNRGNKRLSEIDRGLPDLIDLLTATVEAGMGIAGSMGMLVGRFKGALGDELRLTIQQQTLGISNERALGDFAERCDTPSVRAFVRTLTKSESLGVSVGPILRELATEVRRRRRQDARERMQKAPIKMLFPLMFLIFPALMVELLFPAAYSLVKGLSGGAI